jgi:hypothetical protein
MKSSEVVAAEQAMKTIEKDFQQNSQRDIEQRQMAGAYAVDVPARLTGEMARKAQPEQP